MMSPSPMSALSSSGRSSSASRPPTASGVARAPPAALQAARADAVSSASAVLRMPRARRRYDHRCELRDVVDCAWVGVDADVGGVEFAKGIAYLPAKLGGGAT